MRRLARQTWVAIAAAAVPLAQVPHAYAQAEAAPPAPEAAGPGAAPAETERPRWVLAPVRWGGSAGLEYRRLSSSGGPTVSSVTEDVSIGAATYIWQPWFVQLAGGVGLSATQTDSSGEASTGDSTNVTGNFGLQVFPSSRFPFQLNYSRSDSRTSGDFFGLDYTTDRWSLRQSYRTRGGGTTMSLSADRSTIDSRDFGRDTVDAVGADYATSWDKQQLSINTSYSENDRADLGTGTRQLQAGLQHVYRPDPNLSADSLLSYNRTDQRFRLLGPAIESQVTELRQYSTLATWRPDDEHPLQVLGTLRAFDGRTERAGATAADVRSLGGTAALTYRFSDRLNTFATLSASQVDSENETQALYTESVGVSYTFLPRQVWSSTYVANTSVTAGHVHGDNAVSQSTGGAQFGHTLSRVLGGNERSSWLLSLGQNFGAFYETDRGSTRNLVHSAGLSWRYSGGETFNRTAYASLSFSDSRNYGAIESRFSLVNLQLSGQAQFSQYSVGSANFTVQHTSQESGSFVFPGGSVPLPQARISDNTSVSGSLSYQHVRFMKVPRLFFTSQFTAYQNNFSRAAGDPNAPPEQVSWTFENRIDYFIGRLNLRFGVRLAEIDGRENALLFARINRAFGN